MAKRSVKPDWDILFELASSQDGHFSIKQAKDRGFSNQLVRHHLKGGKIFRVRRGIYRLVQYPASDHEDLVVVWLWSEQVGVFSHQTAMALHDLSDALPAQIHLTLPRRWKSRRLRVLPGVVLHHTNVAKVDRAWFGSVPVTSPLRTLKDCVEAHVVPDLIKQAIESGIDRGLFSRKMVATVTAKMVGNRKGK
ncbi:MAG: type IV toxin-antitoxin system AbiEi family antitoxin domain-containing protein [Deltaproteobacteria bacterium]|nr:type IV toxin-antitoxin system AbiEi family antitoxin domain-containing protein [Deltaproteobacteria bacterium]